LLARRPLTEAELRHKLAERGHPQAEVEEACARLRRAGYLDDAKLAREFITARSDRLGHGPERLVEQLCRRGVERAVADRALEQATDAGDVSMEAVLRQRLERHLRGAAKVGARDYARVYTALRRAGFDAESIRRELDPYRDDPSGDEATHDFP